MERGRSERSHRAERSGSPLRCEKVGHALDLVDDDDSGIGTRGDCFAKPLWPRCVCPVELGREQVDPQRPGVTAREPCRFSRAARAEQKIVPFGFGEKSPQIRHNCFLYGEPTAICEVLIGADASATDLPSAASMSEVVQSASWSIRRHSLAEHHDLAPLLDHYLLEDLAQNRRALGRGTGAIADPCRDRCNGEAARSRRRWLRIAVFESGAGSGMISNFKGFQIPNST